MWSCIKACWAIGFIVSFSRDHNLACAAPSSRGGGCWPPQTVHYGESEWKYSCSHYFVYWLGCYVEIKFRRPHQLTVIYIILVTFQCMVAELMRVDICNSFSFFSNLWQCLTKLVKSLEIGSWSNRCSYVVLCISDCHN